jgi:hypothetical protein
MKYFLFRWGYGSQAHMGGSPLIGQPNSLSQPVGWVVAQQRERALPLDKSPEISSGTERSAKA